MKLLSLFLNDPSNRFPPVSFGPLCGAAAPPRPSRPSRFLPLAQSYCITYVVQKSSLVTERRTRFEGVSGSVSAPAGSRGFPGFPAHRRPGSPRRVLLGKICNRAEMPQLPLSDSDSLSDSLTVSDSLSVSDSVSDSDSDWIQAPVLPQSAANCRNLPQHQTRVPAKPKSIRRTLPSASARVRYPVRVSAEESGIKHGNQDADGPAFGRTSAPLPVPARACRSIPGSRRVFHNSFTLGFQTSAKCVIILPDSPDIDESAARGMRSVSSPKKFIQRAQEPAAGKQAGAGVSRR